MRKQYDPYLVSGSDGHLHDTRIKYGRGDRVRVIRGVLGGLTATVENLVEPLVVDGRTITAYRYELTMDNEKRITVPWDEVEGV